jgi:hypothetical protein
VCPEARKFEYACFISYKHPPKTAPEDHFYKEYAKSLKAVLEKYLMTEIRIFLDMDADPGTAYPTHLPQSLCKSVCMIAILTPEYADSKWCAAEWQAMEKLEAKRLGIGEKGLIIPIVAQGNVGELENIFKRKPLDLKVALTKQLRNAKKAEKIQDLARQIARFVNKLTDPCENCAGFSFELGPEETTYPPKYKDPDPFAS